MTKQKPTSAKNTVEARQSPLPLGFGDLRDYLFYRIPFARVVHDHSVRRYLPALEGRTLELGAGRHNYAPDASGTTEYIRSDYAPAPGDDRIRIDATDTGLDDTSFDSVVCLSALEHIEDYPAALSEMFRILKPGGQLLLCVPWLFPYHGAPDDYHRFSASALRAHLNQFEITEFEAVGNYWISLAMFLQRPTWSRPDKARRTRFYDPLLRLIGAAFLLAGRNRQEPDDNYALLYTCLCRKPVT